jgi:hypothetical protein
VGPTERRLSTGVDSRPGQSAAEGSLLKVLALRRPDTCSICRQSLAVGTQAAWDAASRTVRCLACADGPHADAAAHAAVPEPAAPVSAISGAGASAQREHDKRAGRREATIRTRHPRLGGLLLALFEDPPSTRVWAQGAQGERAVAAKLDELAGDHLTALHDRKMLLPGGRSSRANIDHLAVTATGVWVIDAKTHRGPLEVRRSGGILSPRVEKLFINGRDKTSLLEGLARQVECVRGVLAEADAPVPVHGALCFVGTELPWFGSSEIAGVPLVGRRGLNKLMRRPGELTSADRDALAEFLDRRFVPA